MAERSLSTAKLHRKHPTPHGSPRPSELISRSSRSPEAKHGGTWTGPLLIYHLIKAIACAVPIIITDISSISHYIVSIHATSVKTILYHIVLHYIRSYYIILYYIILYYVTFYYIITFCYIILYYTILHYIMLYYIIFYCIVLHIFYFIVLYCIVWYFYYVIEYIYILFYVSINCILAFAVPMQILKWFDLNWLMDIWLHVIPCNFYCV